MRGGARLGCFKDRGWRPVGARRRTGFACEVKGDTLPLAKASQARARNRRKAPMNQAVHSSSAAQPQSTLPVGVVNEDGHRVYLLSLHPIYRHWAREGRGFRLTIAHLMDAGASVGPRRRARPSGSPRAGWTRRCGCIGRSGSRYSSSTGHTCARVGCPPPSRWPASGNSSPRALARLGSRWSRAWRSIPYAGRYWDGLLDKPDASGGRGTDGVGGRGHRHRLTAHSEGMPAALGALDSAAVRFSTPGKWPSAG